MTARASNAQFAACRADLEKLLVDCTDSDALQRKIDALPLLGDDQSALWLWAMPQLAAWRLSTLAYASRPSMDANNGGRQLLINRLIALD
jgi:hypothetical protein